VNTATGALAIGGQVGTAAAGTAATTGPMADISSGRMNPNDSTNAASQLDAITRDNSPYIQQATQQGLLTAASRGLENSSLGAGAAEAAAVQAAAPLAQTNAGIAAQGKLQNSQLLTQASEFNAGQQNANQQLQAQLDSNTSQFNATNQIQVGETNAAAMNAMRAQTQQIQAQLNTQFVSGSQAQMLAEIQGSYNAFIQQNSSAAAIMQTTLSGISSVLGNSNISPQQASAAVTQILNQLHASLDIMNAIEGGSSPAAAPRPPTTPTPRLPGRPGLPGLQK
jgi:hypothetical protein